MEYNLSKHSVAYAEIFLDTVNEQLVDADITLPDYCPDIEKILKCTLIPKIYTRHISGGQLSIDGVALIKIMYCDSIRHSVRSYEHSSPFAATFNLKTTPPQCIINSIAKCEYINCRALSPRKLSVRGAFSLYAKVISKAYNDFYSFDEQCDLQTKKEKISVSDMCAMCQEQFSFTEDVSVTSKPMIEALLSYETSAHINYVKSIHNKLMLSAELELKLMYISDLENSKIEHFTTAFEINKIFDCENVFEDAVNVSKLEILSSDLSIRNETLSDGSMLSLDVKMCFSDVSYVNKEVSLIRDAYSTKYKTEVKRNIISCENNRSFNIFDNVVKSTLNFDGMNISKITHVYCEGLSLTSVISDNKLALQGKTNVCMLINDENDVPCYVERSVDFEFAPQIEKEFDRASLCDSKIKSISFRLVGENTVDVRIEVLSSLELCSCLSVNPIVCVEYSEDKLVDNDGSALVLCFADKGEDIFDIAKLYNTKEELLVAENNLDSNILENSCMLLVVTE